MRREGVIDMSCDICANGWRYGKCGTNCCSTVSQHNCMYRFQMFQRTRKPAFAIAYVMGSPSFHHFLKNLICSSLCLADSSVNSFLGNCSIDLYFPNLISLIFGPVESKLYSPQLLHWIIVQL